MKKLTIRIIKKKKYFSMSYNGFIQITFVQNNIGKYCLKNSFRFENNY